MFPKSYQDNTRHEKEILELANNFHRQFSYLYPSRIKPPLHLENECKVNKIVCTTLCPFKVKIPMKMKEYNFCANFIADYFDYEILPSPLYCPQQLFSVESIFKKRKGNSLDLSTVLCTLLIASDYDAYVVQGYARKNISEKMMSKELKPPIQFYTDSEYHKRFFTESKSAPQVIHVIENKYDVDFDLMKSYWLDGKSTFQTSEEAKPELPKEEFEEKDIYLRKRIHFWVLILTYENSFLDGFFIEPTTGEKKSIDDQDYLGIEFIWNNENFWCNNQVHELSCKNLKFDLDDFALWEPFLPDFRINEEYDKPIRMPETWVKDTEITKDDLRNRFPEKGRKFHFKMATIAKYNPKSLICGLVHYVSYYRTKEKKEKEETHAFYSGRKDCLEYRKMDFEKKRTTDIFSLGRDDSLKEHEYPLEGQLHFPQILKFYCHLRKDKLTSRVWTENMTYDEFTGRSDRLIARKVNFFQEKTDVNVQSYIEDSKLTESMIHDVSKELKLPNAVDIKGMEKTAKHDKLSKEKLQDTDVEPELKTEESTEIAIEKEGKEISPEVQQLLDEAERTRLQLTEITPSSFETDNTRFFEDIDFNAWEFEDFLNSIDPAERYATSESESEVGKSEYEAEEHRKDKREKREDSEDEEIIQEKVFEKQEQIADEQTEEKIKDEKFESENVPQIIETDTKKIPDEYISEKEDEFKIDLESQIQEIKETKNKKITKDSIDDLLGNKNEMGKSEKEVHFEKEKKDDIKVEIKTQYQETRKVDDALKFKDFESDSQDERNVNSSEKLEHPMNEMEEGKQEANTESVGFQSSKDKNGKENAIDKKSKDNLQVDEQKENNETKLQNSAKGKGSVVNESAQYWNKNDVHKSKSEKVKNELQGGEIFEYKEEPPKDSSTVKVDGNKNEHNETIISSEIPMQENEVEVKAVEIERDSQEDVKFDNERKMFQYFDRENEAETKGNIFEMEEKIKNAENKPQKSKVEPKSRDIESDSREDNYVIEISDKEKEGEPKENSFEAIKHIIRKLSENDVKKEIPGTENNLQRNVRNHNVIEVSKTNGKEKESKLKENIFESEEAITRAESKLQEYGIKTKTTKIGKDLGGYESADYVTEMLKYPDKEKKDETELEVSEIESRPRKDTTNVEEVRNNLSNKNIHDYKIEEKFEANENLEDHSSQNIKTKKTEELEREMEMYDAINFDALSDEELEIDYQLFLTKLWKEYKLIKDSELFYMTHQFKKYKDLHNADSLKLKKKIIRKRRKYVRDMQKVKTGKPEILIYKQKSTNLAGKEKEIYTNEFISSLILEDILKTQNAADMKEFYNMDVLEKPYMNAINAEIIKKEHLTLLDNKIENNKDKGFPRNLNTIRNIQNTYQRDISLPVEYDIENVQFDFEVNTFRIDFHYPPGRFSRKTIIFSNPASGSTDFPYSDNLCRQILPCYQTKLTKRSQLYSYLVNLLKEEPLVKREYERFQNEMKGILNTRIEEEKRFETDTRKIDE